MIAVTATLKSGTPYGPGKYFVAEKLDGESNDKREERTWRERCHYEEESGECFIPGIAFKRSLDAGAQTLSDKVPDKGRQTFTKFFERAVLVTNNLMLGKTREQVPRTSVLVPSNPSASKKGGGSRVIKHFPRFDSWEGELKIVVLDTVIDEKTFHRTLEYAGNFIGVGTWRPENAGMWGRFAIVNLAWNAKEA